MNTPAQRRTQTLAVDTAGLRAIAIFEAAKGMLVLIAGVGVLFFLHHDIQRTLIDLIRHLHMDPASRVPALVAQALRRTDGFDLRLVTAAALVYAAIRFAEATGLWLDRAWGNWIGALSGAIYLPFEFFEVVAHPNWEHVLLIVANLLIVLFLVLHLYHKRRNRLAINMDKIQ